MDSREILSYNSMHNALIAVRLLEQSLLGLYIYLVVYAIANRLRSAKKTI